MDIKSDHVTMVELASALPTRLYETLTAGNRVRAAAPDRVAV
jgi:hypothetical protein